MCCNDFPFHIPDVADSRGVFSSYARRLLLSGQFGPNGTRRAASRASAQAAKSAHGLQKAAGGAMLGNRRWLDSWPQGWLQSRLQSKGCMRHNCLPGKHCYPIMVSCHNRYSLLMLDSTTFLTFWKTFWVAIRAQVG